MRPSFLNLASAALVPIRSTAHRTSIRPRKRSADITPAASKPISQPQRRATVTNSPITESGIKKKLRRLSFRAFFKKASCCWRASLSSENFLPIPAKVTNCSAAKLPFVPGKVTGGRSVATRFGYYDGSYGDLPPLALAFRMDSPFRVMR